MEAGRKVDCGNSPLPCFKGLAITVSLPYLSSVDCCDPQHAKPSHVPCEGGL